PGSPSIRRRISVLGRNVLLCLPSLRVLRICRQTFQHLLHRAPSGDAADSCITVEQGPKGFDIRLDGHLCALAFDENGLAPALTPALFELCIGFVPYRMAIHAAAVEWQGRAVLLPGEAGAGKSMLTAALARAGFGFMSDDLVLLQTPGAK